MSENNENNNSLNNDEKPKSKTGLYIAEGVAAVAAIGVIGFCAVNLSKQSADSVSENATVSENMDPNVTVDPVTGEIISTSGNEVVVGENINFSDYTSAEGLNILTQEEAEAYVEDGTMVLVNFPDGSYAYIVNLDNEEIISEYLSCTDEEIEEIMYQDLLMYFTEDAPEDRTVCQKYDTVNIDYEGYLDGVQFAGGTAAGYSLALGSDTFIDGFEDGVIGMEIGETRDITCTFPEQYQNADLAGQEVIFTVTLNDIEAVPQELTDDIVALAFSGITTAEECVDYYHDLLVENKANVLITDFFYVSELSEDMLKSYFDVTCSYYENTALQYGLSLADLITASGSTVEEFELSIIESAKYSALVEKIYNAIAVYANLEVTDEEVLELAALYGFADLQEFYDYFGETTVMGYLLDQKVLTYICDLAK